MEFLIALLIYPLAVLCVALTGPHSKYERDDMVKNPRRRK